MILYVAGFMFNTRRNIVALIRKKRPPWQAGRFNAIGGKIEEGESPSKAMRREFRQETGIDHAEWEFTVRLVKPEQWEVYFFRAFTDDVLRARQQTDEEVTVMTVHDAKNNLFIIDNLKWLLPLQLDMEIDYPLSPFEIVQSEKDDDDDDDDVIRLNLTKSCAQCGEDVTTDAFVPDPPLCINCRDKEAES